MKARLSWIDVELVLLAGLGIGAGLLGICASIGAFDEGMILVGGQRVLHGELPFRDFYALYPPGQYYVVAALRWAFGPSVLALRLYCVCLRAGIGLLLYLTARQLVPRGVAAACWAASVLLLSTRGFFGYPVFPALFLALLSMALLGRERPHPLFLPAAGAALGAAALFRHDLAAYAFLAELPLVLATVRAGSRSGRPPRQDGLPGAAGLWGRYLGAAVLVFGAPMGALAVAVPVREIVFELFTFPSRTYAMVRGLPYPALLPLPAPNMSEPLRLLALFWNIPFYSPLLFYLAGFLVWISGLRAGGRKALADPASLRLLSIVIFGALSFNLARVRADMIHATAMIVLSYPVAAACVSFAWSARRHLRIPAAGALAIVGLLSLLRPGYAFVLTARHDLDARGLLGPTEVVPCRDAGPDREAAAAYIRSVVPPGGRIFVGCSRHDIIFVNDPILYFLADRLPCTKYHVLDPGIATTIEAQREIVEGLERDDVAYLVLSSLNESHREPNEGSVSSGVTYLDDYLRAHYRPETAFGPYLTVWRRQGDGTPGAGGG